MYSMYSTTSSLFVYINASPSVGTPMAPSNVMVTGSTITWSASAPGLIHRTNVCLVGTTNCSIQISCTSCNSTSITGITESGNYSITVCSSSVVNGVPCMSEACTPPIIEGMLVHSSHVEV